MSLTDCLCCQVPTNPHVALQIAAASSLEAGVLHTGAPVSLSTLQRSPPQIDFPALFLTTGCDDSQVLPWEAKEVAEGGDTAEVKSQLMHEMAARVQRLDYSKHTATRHALQPGVVGHL